MVKLALWVRLEAKSGRGAEVEYFLRSGLTFVQQEPGTRVWFAIRLGPSTFGIFNAFEDEAARQAHLSQDKWPQHSTQKLPSFPHSHHLSKR
jgi:quinol monooxygenase YgiN